MRNFRINGESLVRVKFGGHIVSGSSQVSGSFPVLASDAFVSGPISYRCFDLGLSLEEITIRPRWYHQDIHVDDYGGEVPPEVMALMMDVNIRMNLVHYDRSVLDACISESYGGHPNTVPGLFPGTVGQAGVLAPAGSLLGNNIAAGLSGNHYVSLSILSPLEEYPWRFLTAFFSQLPMEYPLGTHKSAVVCNWRAIPYGYHALLAASGTILSPGQPGYIGGGLDVAQQAPLFDEIRSSKSVLWDHGTDS